MSLPRSRALSANFSPKPRYVRMLSQSYVHTPDTTLCDESTENEIKVSQSR
jgi:hypothetical protein